MKPILRLYRFTRRHADGLVIAAVLACAVLVYGTTQQHDEAMQARAAREARR